jgi:hypothetical protein
MARLRRHAEVADSRDRQPEPAERSPVRVDRDDRHFERSTVNVVWRNAAALVALLVLVVPATYGVRGPTESLVRGGLLAGVLAIAVSTAIAGVLWRAASVPYGGAAARASWVWLGRARSLNAIGGWTLGTVTVLALVARYA